MRASKSPASIARHCRLGCGRRATRPQEIFFLRTVEAGTTASDHGVHLRDPDTGTVSGQFPQDTRLDRHCLRVDGVTGTRRVIAWWAILRLAVYYGQSVSSTDYSGRCGGPAVRAWSFKRGTRDIQIPKSSAGTDVSGIARSRVCARDGFVLRNIAASLIGSRSSHGPSRDRARSQSSWHHARAHHRSSTSRGVSHHIDGLARRAAVLPRPSSGRTQQAKSATCSRSAHPPCIAAAGLWRLSCCSGHTKTAGCPATESGCQSPSSHRWGRRNLGAYFREPGGGSLHTTLMLFASFNRSLVSRWGSAGDGRLQPGRVASRSGVRRRSSDHHDALAVLFCTDEDLARAFLADAAVPHRASAGTFIFRRGRFSRDLD